MSVVIEFGHKRLQGRLAELNTLVTDIKIGQHVMWNFAGESKVVGVESETEKFKTLIFKDDEGEQWTRRVFKNRLMAVKENQKPKNL